MNEIKKPEKLKSDAARKFLLNNKIDLKEQYTYKDDNAPTYRGLIHYEYKPIKCSDNNIITFMLTTEYNHKLFSICFQMHLDLIHSEKFKNCLLESILRASSIDLLKGANNERD